MSAKPFSQIAKECAKIKKQFAITKLNLRERRKELNGIYRIFGILNRPHKSKNINYITILNVITRSFLYKEICAARLILEGKEYKTANFKITPWRLSSAVHFRSKRIGRLDVYYLKKTEKIYKGPFLKEEIDFLSSISDFIGQHYERMVIYDSLQKSESRFKIFFEKAPIGITISKKGILTYVNKRYLKMYGYSKPKELIGKSLVQLVAPEFKGMIASRIKLSEKNLPLPDRYECICIKKNGERFPIINVVAKISFANETESIGFVTDITESKKVEDALKLSTEQLKNYAAHLQTIREEERVYISRELHDNLGQSLTALKMSIFQMIKKLSNERAEGLAGEYKVRLDNLIEQTNQILLTTKNIARNIRPGILDDIGLLPAIEWQIGEFIKTSGIKCTLETTYKDIKMDKAHNIEVYRIVQEALTNVLRHSKAKKVRISIKESNNYTAVMIKDNGVGISNDEISNIKSLGILGMRERAKLFGGELSIEGKKQKGTKITLKIPFINN